jgi:hypothetical protein
MTRSRNKSNRLKKNKTKRCRQTKNKRRRQTKNKRRRQHGGAEYQYTQGSQIILKPGSVTDPVLIPGYSEIMDMMKEYETDESEKLNQGIKQKDVQLIRECSLPHSIEEGKIIVLRKEDKKFAGFLFKKSSIECSPEQYYDLASRNFKIFIQDILGWNPFLNLPKKPIKIDRTSHQFYGGPGPHVYESDQKFKNGDWWNKQQWWINYQISDDFNEQISRAATTRAEAVETAKVAAEKELEAALLRDDPSAVGQQRVILRLIRLGIYDPELYSTSTRS